MKKKATEYFNNGYSCSESIVKAAIEEGFCEPILLSAATSFSGGMSSGCLCGAIAGAQIVIGHNFGRENSQGNELMAREKAKALIDEFVSINKVTCCRALTRGLEGSQRKEHCTKMVADCAQILENLIKVKV